jgi:hypothetical protein
MKSRVPQAARSLSAAGKPQLAKRLLSDRLVTDATRPDKFVRILKAIGRHLKIRGFDKRATNLQRNSRHKIAGNHTVDNFYSIIISECHRCKPKKS